MAVCARSGAHVQASLDSDWKVKSMFTYQLGPMALVLSAELDHGESGPAPQGPGPAPPKHKFGFGMNMNFPFAM